MNIPITNCSCFDPALLPSAPDARPWRGGSIPALLIFYYALVLTLTVISSSAEEPHPTESQVKAAYLYNFGKFVTWPATPAPSADSREICVLGKDPFGSVLDSTVAGESIDGKKIEVRRLAKAQDAAHCSILFVSESEASRLDAILPSLRRFGALTVSDIPHFAEHGGMIEFVMQQNKIRFAVNRAAAQQSHLVLSSELLKVAIRVIDKPQGQP
ncbi:MAG: YfiR family protein [Terriglobales bacterium]